jgi:malonyl-CoA/methylmalonyl-CoA synthetase
MQMTKDESSFYDELAASFSQAGERTLLTAGARHLSGTALLAAVERWAGALASLGVAKGDRVAVQAPKSLDLILLYLATLRLGAVYLPLNSSYTRAEIDYFLGDAEPALFVCDPADCATYAEAATLRGFALHGLDAQGYGSLAESVDANERAAPSVSVSPGDLAAIVYTSGTTGRSKGAMITHRNLASNARALIQCWGIVPGDVLLHVLPLYHIHGLFISLNTLLLAGARTDLHAAFDSGAVLAALPSATLFMGVPTYYTRLLADPGLDAAAAVTIHLFVCGSAPLTPATFDAFEARTGHRILERYGMSECGVICSNPLVGDRLPGAVGTPLPGVTVRIADGAPVGVLEVAGPNVCDGYWRQPDKTRAEFLDDGYFVTGDIGTIDDLGVVRIVGREKDLIISGGLNIYPKEIESVINAYGEVDESAVIGLPHADFGEGVAAVVRLNPGAELTQEALIARLKAELAGFKLPKAVFFVDELPRNAMGKVQKAALRKTYHQRFDG